VAPGRTVIVDALDTPLGDPLEDMLASLRDGAPARDGRLVGVQLAVRVDNSISL
jgi:hypothetical protein